MDMGARLAVVETNIEFIKDTVSKIDKNVAHYSNMRVGCVKEREQIKSEIAVIKTRLAFPAILISIFSGAVSIGVGIWTVFVK